MKGGRELSLRRDSPSVHQQNPNIHENAPYFHGICQSFCQNLISDQRTSVRSVLSVCLSGFINRKWGRKVTFPWEVGRRAKKASTGTEHGAPSPHFNRSLPLPAAFDQRRPCMKSGSPGSLCDLRVSFNLQDVCSEWEWTNPAASKTPRSIHALCSP